MRCPTCGASLVCGVCGSTALVYRDTTNHVYRCRAHLATHRQQLLRDRATALGITGMSEQDLLDRALAMVENMVALEAAGRLVVR